MPVQKHLFPDTTNINNILSFSRPYDNIPRVRLLTKNWPPVGFQNVSFARLLLLQSQILYLIIIDQPKVILLVLEGIGIVDY